MGRTPAVVDPEAVGQVVAYLRWAALRGSNIFLRGTSPAARVEALERELKAARS